MKYSLSPREISRVKPKGFPEGSGYISLYLLTRATAILIYKSSIDLPGISILEELILRIALIAGQYGKINFNSVMFSNGECAVLLHL